MIFIKNKYTRIYYSIVDNAQQQTRKKLKRDHPDYIYYDKHHIIPKSLGGNNEKLNLVLLTGQEHFICHWLLTKMTANNHKHKMIYALSMMRCNNRLQGRYSTGITSRVYASLKGKRIVSEETRAKMLISNKGRNIGRIMSDEEKINRGNSRRGATHSEETKAKIGAVHKGKVMSEETKAKLRIARAKQVTTDETRAKMSAAHKGRVSNKKVTLASAETKAKMSESHKRRWKILKGI